MYHLPVSPTEESLQFIQKYKTGPVRPRVLE